MGEQALFWTGEGLQFEARTGHGLPFAVGGERDGDGAKPADLLPVSLAACTAYDVVVILRKQRQDLRGLRVQITSRQEPDRRPQGGTRDRALRVEVLLGGGHDPAHGGPHALARDRGPVRALMR